MKVRYIGPFDEVLLRDQELLVKRGGVVDVEPLAHANLCSQHDWENAEAVDAPDADGESADEPKTKRKGASA